MPISLILTPFDHFQICPTFAVNPNLILEPCLILLTQVPLNLITATTLMLVKSGQLEDRGLVFGLLSLFLLLAAIVAASIETKEEKRE